MSLVERAVRGLLACGLEQVVVVVGYQAGTVGTIVNRLAPGRVHLVFAEGWEAGNGASLAAAEPFVGEEELFVLVTADHVFGEGALDALLAAGGPAALVDTGPGSDVWTAGTRVRIVDGRARAFGTHLIEPAVDCGAFVLPRRIFEYHLRAADAGDGSLAGAVTELSVAEPVLAVALPTGRWWHDVDTPEDLRVRPRAGPRVPSRRAGWTLAHHRGVRGGGAADAGPRCGGGDIVPEPRSACLLRLEDHPPIELRSSSQGSV